MSLPIISLTDPQSVDLQPWILVRYVSGTHAEVSLWAIDQVGLAIAIFTSIERAEQYRAQLTRPAAESEQSRQGESAWSIVQPTEVELGKWMVAHFQAGVKWLVLDPSKQDAKRVFALAEVLKGLRQRLTASTQ